MSGRGLRPDAWLVIAGAAVVVLTALVGSGFNPLSIPFAAWGALPWVALWYLGRMMPVWVSGGAAATALAAEIGIRSAVFVWPRSSTAAIALLFSPVFIAVIVMPAGMAAGWLCGRLWQWHLLGRVAVVVIAAVILGLLMLGLARPDALFIADGAGVRTLQPWQP